MTQKTGITVGLDLPEQAEHSRRIHYAITLTVSAVIIIITFISHVCYLRSVVPTHWCTISSTHQRVTLIIYL